MSARIGRRLRRESLETDELAEHSQCVSLHTDSPFSVMFEQTISHGETLLNRLQTAAHIGRAKGFGAIPTEQHPRNTDVEAWYGTASELVNTVFGSESPEALKWATAMSRYPEFFKIACNTESNAGVATLYARGDHVTICLGVLRAFAASTQWRSNVELEGNDAIRDASRATKMPEGFAVRADRWLGEHARRYGRMWTLLATVIGLLLAAVALFV